MCLLFARSPLPRFRGAQLNLLAPYDHRRPLLLGELKPGGSYACGGAGTVLSRAAALRMSVPRCIAQFRRRCMQSDWMLADCAKAWGVHFEGSHGCGSCSVRLPTAVADDLLAANLSAGCQFMQNAGRHLARLPSNCSSPSIVHGYTPDARLVSAVLIARVAQTSTMVATGRAWLGRRHGGRQRGRGTCAPVTPQHMLKRP